jgi:succinyl-CoA synthetase beta subunit
MKIHEHEAKELFRNYGIAAPRGRVVRTPEEAVLAAKEIGSLPIVLKAQIYAGGRGKAGGIRIAKTVDEVSAAAEGLLDHRLVTAQTGADGQPVHRLLIEEALAYQKELYLGITMDRSAGSPVVIASSEGGVEVERLARETPEKIVKEYIDPAFGLRPFQAARVSYALGLPPLPASRCAATLLSLYKLFTENDCSNVEINPLAVTGGQDLIALDGKVNIDDNALFRQPRLASLRDVAQENALDVEASRFGLNYIKLHGNVGCMVNGAGLAMATMDLIKHIGAEPANFLDVGGSATAPMIKEGLRIILADADVEILFINIFGGILRCDTLAKGFAEGAKELGLRVPVVIRLEGTNREMGQEMLLSTGLNFFLVSGMGEAASQISALLGLQAKKAPGAGKIESASAENGNEETCQS